MDAQPTMHRHGFQVDVEARPEAVWAALSDFGGKSWKPKVVEARAATDQTSGVGAEQLIQHLILKEFTVRVTEWEEGQRLIYEFDGLPAQLPSMANAWSLSPADSGVHVVVRQEWALDLGEMSGQAAPFVQQAMAEELIESIAGLKCHIETGEIVTSDFLQVDAKELRERYTSVVKLA